AIHRDHAALRFRALLSARAIGRHEAAGGARPGARHRAGRPLYGRAVRRPRLPHPPAPARRADPALAADRPDHPVRHPRRRRGGPARRPDRRDGTAPLAHSRGRARASPAPARSGRSPIPAPARPDFRADGARPSGVGRRRRVNKDPEVLLTLSACRGADRSHDDPGRTPKMTLTIRAHFALVLPALLFASACSSNPKVQPVRVAYSDIAVENSTPPQPAGPPAPAPVPASADPNLAAVPAALSTREIIDRSMLWSVEGLGSYARGNYPAAYQSLNGARILLLGADMPEYWKEQGLAVLQPGLPKELRRYDLRAVFQELEQVRAKEPTEKAEATY